MKTMILLLVAGLMVLGATAAFAVNTATQTVTYGVTAIDELSVSGDPGPLIVSAAIAGEDPTSVTDATTTYSVTTNGTGMRITGVLDTAMPAGLTLSITLASTGATSAGAVILTAVPADLVTGISSLAETNGITYELAATAAAAIVDPSATKTVTLTLTAGV